MKPSSSPALAHQGSSPLSRARAEFELRDPAPRAKGTLTVKERDVAGLHKLAGVKF